MAAVDRQLAAQSEQLLEAMTNEVDALRIYLSKITGLMEELSDRSVALEALVGQSIQSAASFEDMVDTLPERFAELSRTRRIVQDAIWTEQQNSQNFTDMATKHMRTMRDNVARLKKELGDYD